jgi:hypothetical protein
MPSEIESGMTAWEMALFDADFDERPPEDEQANFHGALHAALIYNSNRSKGSSAKDVKDFSVRSEAKRPKRAQTRGEMETVLRMLAAANGPQQGVGSVRQG